MISQKLALGTVQLGLAYGINNSEGIIPEEKICSLLDLAYEKGINTLDTAYAYGVSEERIGRYLKDSVNLFNLITKVPNVKFNEIERVFNESLSRLNVDSVYGCLFHDINTYKNDLRVYEEIVRMKREKKVEKIGFSLYFPRDLEWLLDNAIQFDLVQIPFSIFDQRFKFLLGELHKRNVEIHVRSIFLQGLVFKNPYELPKSFQKIQNRMIALKELSELHKIKIADLCLYFPFSNSYIDKIVIGVDNSEQLLQLLEAETNQSKIADLNIDFDYYQENDEEIILPFNWRIN